jgi:hypothetical protein
MNDRYVIEREVKKFSSGEESVFCQYLYIYDSIDGVIVDLDYFTDESNERLTIKAAQLNDDHFYLKEIEDYTHECTYLIGI